MNAQGNSWTANWGLVPLRLVVGLVFIVHGGQKLFSSVSAAPGARLAAALLAVDMVVAILAVRLAAGFVGGDEFELALLGASLSLALLGAGLVSVKKVFARRAQAAG